MLPVFYAAIPKTPKNLNLGNENGISILIERFLLKVNLKD